MARSIRKMKLKICLVGERAVGKSSLVRRYVYNTFDDAYRATLGSKLHLLSFSKYVVKDVVVDAQIALFDLMGEHAPRDVFRDAMFWGAHGFLAVADLTRPPTLAQLPEWVRAVTSVAGGIPYVIVLNKSDLRGGAIGPRETQWLLATFPQVPYALTSAKTGEGVGEAFQDVLDRGVDGVLERSRARREVNVVAGRLLAFAHRRGAAGVSKGELLHAFKGTDYGALMEEVDALTRIGYITVEQISPSAFRILLTSEGEAAVPRIGLDEFVVEEPT